MVRKTYSLSPVLPLKRSYPKIFGGQDASGNILSEVWLLRAYNSSVSPSNPIWSGFGDGRLQTGVDANGAGVGVTYLSSCASRLSTSPTFPTPQPGNSTTALPESPHVFDTSRVHKVLAPLSLALFQMVFLVFRLTSPLYGASEHIEASKLLTHRTMYGYVASVLAVASYALGSAGLATSFTTISAQSTVASLHLQTGHGISGLLFFALLYIVLPLAFVVFRLRIPRHTTRSQRVGLPDAAEKASDLFEATSKSMPHSTGNSTGNMSSTECPRHEINPGSPIQEGQEGSDSDHSTRSVAAAAASGPQRRFEVLNRPPRARKISGLSYPPLDTSPEELAARSLQDIDWLQRRRSVNMVVRPPFSVI